MPVRSIPPDSACFLMLEITEAVQFEFALKSSILIPFYPDCFCRAECFTPMAANTFVVVFKHFILFLIVAVDIKRALVLANPAPDAFFIIPYYCEFRRHSVFHFSSPSMLLSLTFQLLGAKLYQACRTPQELQIPRLQETVFLSFLQQQAASA